MPDVEHFITSELDRAHIDYRVNRSFIEISCPYHLHSGTKKKLGFSRRTGGMSCWVCGKKGHWNEYANEKGLAKFDIDDAQLQSFASLARELDAIFDDRDPESPDYVIPWERPAWRRLPKKFLIEVPSYEWYDPQSKANRILWPIYVNDKFKGCTTARINPDDESVFPKTRNLGGMVAKKLLFPFDHPLVRDSKVVVLVEGVFDALRLLYQGVPAVAILGTGTWDPHVLTLLALRDVKVLILAFDGDLAGENLGDAVTADAESMFDVRLMVFPNPDKDERAQGIKKIDPGNCKLKYVKVIRRMVRTAA